MSPKIKENQETISIGSSELANVDIDFKSPESIVVNQIPPKITTRNKYGLLENIHINYIYNEDGTINWRKMVKTEYLVPNRQKTQETDVSKLEDKDLLILLGGIKELAQIRGYKEIVFEALADESFNNTKSFARFFLAAIAENRAFVRCVRNFLKINIVSQEELGDVKILDDSSSQENPTSPYTLLEKVMKDKSISLDQLKKKISKEDNIEINTINDIPKVKIFELIERIKNIKK